MAGLIASLPQRADAVIITVDFETRPVLPTQPSDFFTAGASQSYSDANYAISGGVVLGDATFLAAFPTHGSLHNLYMTTDIADPSLLDTITLDLPPATVVVGVTGVLFNGQDATETYVVTAFSGVAVVNTQTFNNVEAVSSTSAFRNFSLNSTLALPITRVTVTTPNAGTNGYTFGVDTLGVNQTFPTPEPGTCALLVAGAGLLGVRRRRKSGQPTVATLALCLAFFAVGMPAVAGPVWVQQGGGPIINGQDEGITTAQGNNPVSGSIQAVAPSATDSNTIYVATTNGGVWKTTNATAATPTWTPLTDQALPALSLGSIGISPLDPNVILAGASLTSSYANDGGTRFGVARSTDGGSTWTVVGTTLANKQIRSIVPTSTLVSGSPVVLAGTSTGVYRSIDSGVTYTQIVSGITTNSVTDLVRDPGVSTRFYATSNGTIFRSEDTGANWVNANGAGFGVVAGARVLLSVHNSAGNDIVYAAVITNGALTNVYRSANQGANWTALGTPSPVIFPGGQGDIHGALLADRTDPNTVWISGDRQDTPFPNANGANNYSGNVFRNVSGVWANMVMNGANGTSPHADSRGLAFDASGNIIHVNDGGIFKLTNPSLSTRVWSSLIGNITPTEAHSATYDSLTNTVLFGTQDTGTGSQLTAGGALANDLLQGDGGNVAIDSDQTAHAGNSIRYMGFTGLPAYRLTFNAANSNISGYVALGLNITAGSGSGLTIYAFDANVQFYNPYVLNRINGSRMLIGTQNIYESANKGDSFTNLGAAGGQVGNGFSGNPGMAYGGRLNGVAFPDVFYTAAGTVIKHRVTSGGAISTLATYPGSSIRAIAMDPQNYTHIFVVDTTSQGRVWASFDEGATWMNFTANIATFSNSLRTIEVFSPAPTPLNTVLLVGGAGGVWQMRRPGSAGTAWTTLTAGMPKALVYDLRYDYTDNVLVAGTLGRGVWTLTSFFRGGGGTGLPSALPPGEPVSVNLTGEEPVPEPLPSDLPTPPPAALLIDLPPDAAAQ